MKKIFIFSILTICLSSKKIYSQHICGYSNVEYNTYLCIEGYTNLTVSLANQEIISSILQKVGIPNVNFKIKSCPNTFNAVAYFDEKSRQRYIILDEYFLYILSRKNKDDLYWNSLFIAAHEIAHHLYGHTLKGSETKAEQRLKELECDRFAGLVIRKFGGSLRHIYNVLRTIAPSGDDTYSTHPSFEKRYQIAKQGYEDEIATEKSILKKYNVISEKEFMQILKQERVNEARFLLSDLRNFGNKKDVKRKENVILAYQKAIAEAKDDDELYHELAEVYMLYDDYNNALFYKKQAYDLKAKPEYLVSLWAICKDMGKPCYEYEHPISKIDDTQITNNQTLKDLATYYGMRGKYQKAFDLLQRVIKSYDGKLNWAEKDLWKADIPILTDAYNDISIVLLRNEKYFEAYDYINKAIEIIEKYPSLYDGIDLKNVDEENIAKTWTNKALIEMRLMQWSECLATCQKIRKNYPTHFEIADGTISYFEGRSLYGRKKYQEAIQKYTEAIQLGDKNDYNYLYYYRGLAKLAINQANDAKLDFRLACDFGLEEACKQLK